ncbi:hypothetical protein Aave_1755 [Paracidovorax citrulli AAC00-1]|uniref:Uncharacterized protein n=1 Tax=Paracidovorax citrulli (strain AAC00-1) TaxID=397945 RepID=A1TN04_PARC0|nr:hypothetical protein Aave_1755 [Paracidovorax citrulli AAC00-1]
MADWTSTTTTTWEPDWMRSTTRDRLAACRAVHAAPGRPGREKASSAAHPGEKIVPAMRNFRYAEDATEREHGSHPGERVVPEAGNGALVRRMSRDASPAEAKGLRASRNGLLSVLRSWVRAARHS